MWGYFKRRREAKERELAEEFERDVQDILDAAPVISLRLYDFTKDTRHPSLDPRRNDRIGQYHVTGVDVRPGGRVWFFDMVDGTAGQIYNCTLHEWQLTAHNLVEAGADVYVQDNRSGS